MTLFLVQHGKAKPETEDPERSLTEQAAEVVGRMADWAAQVGLAADQIQHSGKRRAEQTATIFAKRLSPPKGVIAVKGMSPKDDVKPVAASLRSDQGSIMLRASPSSQPLGQPPADRESRDRGRQVSQCGDRLFDPGRGNVGG